MQFGGDANLGDPAIHGVLNPVLIGEDGQAFGAPGFGPGVLDDEALGGVTDDDEGVAAIVRGRLLMRNYPVARGFFGGIFFVVGLPGGVAGSAGVEDADLIERDLHVGYGAMVDAVVGAERALDGVLPPVALGSSRRACPCHSKDGRRKRRACTSPS